MTDTTQYLVRWLCHDLATPIASVLTASELLDDRPDPEINELILFGARRLSARLRLVRLALGAAESAMGAVALERLVREGLDGFKVEWTWTGDATDGMAGLVAGCAMLVCDLNRNRTIRIEAGGVSVPEGCNWPDSVAAVFSGDAPCCNRGAVAAMLMRGAMGSGRKLSCNERGLFWD